MPTAPISRIWKIRTSTTRSPRPPDRAPIELAPADDSAERGRFPRYRAARPWSATIPRNRGAATTGQLLLAGLALGGGLARLDEAQHEAVAGAALLLRLARRRVPVA